MISSVGKTRYTRVSGGLRQRRQRLLGHRLGDEIVLEEPAPAARGLLKRATTIA